MWETEWFAWLAWFLRAALQNTRLAMCDSLPERLVISVELGLIPNSANGFLRFACLFLCKYVLLYVVLQPTDTYAVVTKSYCSGNWSSLFTKVLHRCQFDVPTSTRKCC